MAEITQQRNANNKPVVRVYDGIRWGWEAIVSEPEDPCCISREIGSENNGSNVNQISGFPDTVENLDSASVPESSTSKGLLALGVIVGMLKIFQSNKRCRDSERQILSQSN